LKIAINAGHTIKGAGYGAVSGKLKESEIVRKVKVELIKQLRAKGHTVYDCTVDTAETQNDYLKKTVTMTNNKSVDIFLSLHCNAGGGNGVEAYTWKGKKLDKAVHLCYELSRLGFRNRGIKDGSKLYVVKGTKAPAILIELFFLDNQTDQALYNKQGYKGIAKAISEAF
jgi:N-acetylmuramoyl-L-alanine amidase